MANETINDQTSMSALATDDIIPIWDVSSGTQKKITFANFFAANIALGSGNYFSADKIRARSSSGLRIEDDAGNLGMFVQDSTGYVGIGTASPLRPLHIEANSPEFAFGTTGSTANNKLWRMRVSSSDGSYNFETLNDAANSAANALSITRSGTTTSVMALMQSAGSVAIRQTTANAVLDINGDLRAGYDSNTASFLGRARIGYDGATSDWASFSHLDQSGSANSALSQTNAGATWVNAVSGQNVNLATGGTQRIIMNATQFYPNTDSGMNLGKSGNRWVDVWATNGTIQTSDEREKVSIRPSDLGLTFVRALTPIAWVWANSDSPAVTETRFNEDGTEYEHVLREAISRRYRRPHYGLSAQQVRATLDRLGITDFAGYIHDPETDSYALRYSEFIGPIIAAIQELATAVEQLQGASTSNG